MNIIKWDPRNPDIAAIIRSNKTTLYRDPLNRRLFPDGSVIAGFRRRRNLGSLLAPTRRSLSMLEQKLKARKKNCTFFSLNLFSIPRDIP